MIDEDIFIEILNMSNLPVTHTRIIILHFLLEQNQPFISLQQILKMPHENISRTTLYRTLMIFCEAGIIYRIIDLNNKVLYGIGERLKPYIKHRFFTNKNNYHFQCESCNTIICLPDPITPLQLPVGFIKTNANMLLSGYCNNCSGKKSIVLMLNRSFKK